MDDKWHMPIYRFWHLYIYKHQYERIQTAETRLRVVMFEIDTILAENIDYRYGISEKSENECPL